MTTHDYYCAWNGTVANWSPRGFRDAELLKLKAGRSHNPSAIYAAAAATAAAPAAPATDADATTDIGTATAAAVAHADTTEIDAGSGIRQVLSSTSLTGCEPVAMSDEDGQFLGRPETLDMTMRELLEYAAVNPGSQFDLPPLRDAAINTDHPVTKNRRVGPDRLLRGTDIATQAGPSAFLRRSFSMQADGCDDFGGLDASFMGDRVVDQPTVNIGHVVSAFVEQSQVPLDNRSALTFAAAVGMAAARRTVRRTMEMMAEARALDPDSPAALGAEARLRNYLETVANRRV